MTPSSAAGPLAVASNQSILSRYLERTPKSRGLSEQAKTVLPGGIAHDARILDPYCIYTEKAQGGHKTDVDGNQYVDYIGGHGALLLGHNHPTVVGAAYQALQEGTQYGSNHIREIHWAELITSMVPCAEMVRFTSSGTEATLLALRLARAFTGRRKILRFTSHFHGWHDHMAFGYANHFDGTPTPGVLDSIAEQVILVESGDAETFSRCLEADDDIAACIVEPTGGSFGMVPVKPAFLSLVRAETEKRGILLIFDEVITGFRVAPGGAQSLFNVTPDMATFAKIVAGGLPGAALTGRRDILSHLDAGAMAAAGKEKVPHQGTFNANPVSAAAGIAALQIIRDTDAIAKADATAAAIRNGLNAILTREGIPWAAYGTSSGFHIYTNPHGLNIEPANFDPYALPVSQLKARDGKLVTQLHLAMCNEGIDLSGWPGGIVSSAHTEADVEATCTAFAAALSNLRADGLL